MEELHFTESEITLDLLAEVFRIDAYRCQRIDDAIVVREGLSTPTYISIDDHSGALKFRTRVPILDSADPTDTADLVQHLNNSVTCCQFWLGSDDDENEYLCGSAFLIIHFGFKLLEFYYFVTAFSSAFAAGCRLASEHNLIDVKSATH
jgi:hypothetical protein